MRKIIHVDLDAFFCSVEELKQPALYGKPFAVGGNADERGVVSSCSYAARRLGVRSAMPMARAQHICPSLLVLPPDFHTYQYYSQQVMTCLHGMSPLVEQVSIDEAFLDVSDLRQPGVGIAEQLQKHIRDQTGLPSSLGVAANKLVAKIATDAGKAAHRGDTPPCAITIVPPGGEAAFLARLPVQAMWGVGPKTAAKLERMQIITLGDLARQPEALLVSAFGKNGIDLLRHAQGVDDTPIVMSRDVQSISQETTFRRDTADRSTLHLTIRRHAEQVGRRLRQEGMVASTVRIKLRWHDFTTFTRQETLPMSFDQDSIIFNTALRLFDHLWSVGRPVRLLGVGVSGLSACVRQLSLWDTPGEKERRLLEALDELQKKFGKEIIHRYGDTEGG
jgi:DNA polymerase-4